MSTKVLLIDALNLIRRIYAVDCNQSNLSHEQILKSASQRVLNATKKLLRLTQATHAIAVFDGDKSWRYTYYPLYKQNRSEMPPELKQGLDLFKQNFNDAGILSFSPEQDEADDIIATLANKISQKNISCTIVSTDKGFLPLLNKNVEIYDYFSQKYINEDDVHNKFNLPIHKLIEFWSLAGDTTNDIPGVKGVGKKTAEKILNEFHNVESALEDQNLPEKIKTKITHSLSDFITAKVLVTLRNDIHLGFSLKQLRVKSN
ncbi:flap endonuclease Xni [Pseudoalteromonas denitrificans]|uniref:Protein Xni n=1 Tax=Pseudoalteromonas denitrificans DSM 6059 TaxID=1123010 RepID=A0A1I1H0U2_9GAMM|nr:flap endonuclease Xni [Pseudoalteromonas denitrificans]SFC15023.1 protein Xni [Pseudoalteromonas denitrificans DSM 6059]